MALVELLSLQLLALGARRLARVSEAIGNWALYILELIHGASRLQGRGMFG
jgi:hypothetical protein